MTTSQTDDHRETFRIVVPSLLSFVSGFVDTCGFLGFSGLLTSQVTGSLSQPVQRSCIARQA